MQEISFSYLRNFFNNATKGNLKRMLILSRDHVDKLRQRAAGDPVLTGYLQGLEPRFLAFTDALNRSANISLDRQTHTFRLETALQELRGLVEDWDIRIAFRHRPATADYKFLMGMGRTPFSASPYDQRLNLVKELAERLARYPELDDVRADVSAWHKRANELRSMQQGLEGELQSAQANCEEARVALAARMHWVYSGLMHHYFDRPWEVETFYELKYLQRTSAKASPVVQEESPQSAGMAIAAESGATLLEGSFDEESAFEFRNTGNASVSVWMGAEAASPLPPDATVLSPGTTTIVYGDELGDGNGPYRYLLAYNGQGATGKISVSKLDG